MIVTLGIFLIINALQRRDLGDAAAAAARAVPELPDDQFVLAEGPPRFAVRYGAIGTWVTLAIVVAVLWFFFQKTKLGLGYRAVASNSRVEPARRGAGRTMLMLGWAISAVLGTIAAIMVSQSASTLDFNLMATCSSTASRPRRSAGSTASLAQWSAVSSSEWPRRSSRVLQLHRVGAEPRLALAVIVVVLLVRPQGLFGTKTIERMWPSVVEKGSPKTASGRLSATVGVVAMILWMAGLETSTSGTSRTSPPIPSRSSA